MGSTDIFEAAGSAYAAGGTAIVADDSFQVHG